MKALYNSVGQKFTVKTQAAGKVFGTWSSSKKGVWVSKNLLATLEVRKLQGVKID